jgi:hypothetical protein
MTGLPQFNFPAFDAAQAWLEKNGKVLCINPAEEDRQAGYDPTETDEPPSPAFLQQQFRHDVLQIMDNAKSLTLLPGWEHSKGARAEKAVAEWFGLPVYSYTPGEGVSRMEVPSNNQRPGGSILPQDAQDRKDTPIYSGCVAYFPLALAAVARISQKGADQHCGGVLFWDRTKSGDELDSLCRHVIDGDWEQVAWRALAHLQKMEELRLDQPPSSACNPPQNAKGDS